jgi:hypothetical protein
MPAHRARTVRNLVRFHWRAGARVALRANGIVGATVVFLFALDIDAIAHLRLALLELVSRVPDWSARSELAGICVVLAAVGMPRITLGSTGWMRSLAISGNTARRAAVIALCATQAFAIAVWAAALVASPLVYRHGLEPAKVAGIPLIVVAAAALVVPVEHRAGPLLAAVALGLALPGRWMTNVAAVVALAVSDAVSGRLVPFRGAHLRRVRGHRRVGLGNSAVGAWMRLTLRALPASTIAASVLLPIVFLAFGYLIVLHNPDLDQDTATRTVRISGMLASIAFASSLASGIVRARPAWPWTRSLPWSSRHRVLGDTVLHGSALATLAASQIPLDARSAIVVLLLAPPLAAAAAAAIRQGAGRQTSAAGEIALIGCALGSLVALWPWVSAIALATTPLLLTLGMRRERRLVATRWRELHHDAAGDPAWTTAS